MWNRFEKFWWWFVRFLWFLTIGREGESRRTNLGSEIWHLEKMFDFNRVWCLCHPKTLFRRHWNQSRFYFMKFLRWKNSRIKSKLLPFWSVPNFTTQICPTRLTFPPYGINNKVLKKLSRIRFNYIIQGWMTTNAFFTKFTG